VMSLNSSMSDDAAGSEERVIVIGGGLSGLATALGAALRGRRVTVFESAGLLGGAAAYSGGQVWVGANHVAERDGIHDDLARAERYVTGIAHARPELLDVAAMRRWLTAAPEAMRHWERVGAVRWKVISGLADYHADVRGAAADGRYLTTEPVAAGSLGTWRSRLRISPYFGMGTTYSELFEQGRRQTAARVDTSALTFGTGLVAGFLAKVIDHGKVEILTSHRVTELLTGDDGTVAGARADGPAGPVRRNGPVEVRPGFDAAGRRVPRGDGLLGADAARTGPGAGRRRRAAGGHRD